MYVGPGWGGIHEKSQNDSPKKTWSPVISKKTLRKRLQVKTMLLNL